MSTMRATAILLTIQVIASHVVGTYIGKSVARIVWAVVAQLYYTMPPHR
jgi:hypothetical protein